MQKSISHLEDQLHGIHALGYSATALVDAVKVTYHGQQMPLKHLAHSSAEQKRVTIQPYDPTIVSAIVTACKAAGFDAYVFSKEAAVINLPDPSGETKEEMKKRIRELGEQAKVAVRNIRKQYKRGLKNLDETSRLEGEKQIQEVTDRACDIVDSIVDRKNNYL